MLVHLASLECGTPYRPERLHPEAGQRRGATCLVLNPDGEVLSLAKGLTEWA